jgi:hypothetical protein
VNGLTLEWLEGCRHFVGGETTTRVQIMDIPFFSRQLDAVLIIEVNRIDSQQRE